MVTACHLVNVRYSIEVVNTDSLVLGAVTNINFIMSQSFLAPLKWMIEKKFVSVMQEFPDEKNRQVGELPVLPEWKLDSIKVMFLGLS